jgi:hypothetical protein
VLHHDAPAEMKDQFSPGYRELLGDLGIGSTFDLQQRGEQIRERLPRVSDVAESIMAANAGVVD